MSIDWLYHAVSIVSFLSCNQIGITALVLVTSGTHKASHGEKSPLMLDEVQEKIFARMI